MTEKLHSTLAGARQKWEEPSRVEDALARDAEDTKHARAWNKAIDARDGRQCRACGKHTDPDSGLLLRGHRAHIIYASAGGSMEPSNRVTLCAGCHAAEHKDDLRFTAEGGPYSGIDANQGMEFWRKDDAGRFYLSVREMAPHQHERD